MIAIDQVVFEEAVDLLLSAECLLPTSSSQEKRTEIADYIKSVLKSKFENCVVALAGSFPLSTYLPESDLDLVLFIRNAVGQKDMEHVLNVFNALCREIAATDDDKGFAFKIRNVEFINARIKLSKCYVNNIGVDITVNQLSSLSAIAFLEEADLCIGQNHLFKRSLLLIKSWCIHESVTYCGAPLIGSRAGGLTSYAISVMVLYLFNKFTVNLSHPFSVLRCFLFTYANFNWMAYVLSLDGPIPVVNGQLAMSLENNPPSFNRFAHIQRKIQSAREAEASSENRHSSGRPRSFGNFLVRLCNIQDPLEAHNNLGNPVSAQSLHLLSVALVNGSKHLESLLHNSLVAPNEPFQANSSLPTPTTAFVHAFFGGTTRAYLGPTYVRADLRDHPLQVFDAAEAADISKRGKEASLDGDLDAMWTNLRLAVDICRLAEEPTEKLPKLQGSQLPVLQEESDEIDVTSPTLDIAVDSAIEREICVDSAIEREICVGSAIEREISVDSAIEREICVDSAIEREICVGSAIEREISVDSAIEREISVEIVVAPFIKSPRELTVEASKTVVSLPQATAKVVEVAAAAPTQSQKKKAKFRKFSKGKKGQKSRSTVTAASSKPVSSKEDWEDELDSSLSSDFLSRPRISSICTDAETSSTEPPPLVLHFNGTKPGSPRPTRVMPSIPSVGGKESPVVSETTRPGKSSSEMLEFYSLSVLRSLSFDLFSSSADGDKGRRRSYTETFLETNRGLPKDKGAELRPEDSSEGQQLTETPGGGADRRQGPITQSGVVKLLNDEKGAKILVFFVLPTFAILMIALMAVALGLIVGRSVRYEHQLYRNAAASQPKQSVAPVFTRTDAFTAVPFVTESVVLDSRFVLGPCGSGLSETEVGWWRKRGTAADPDVLVEKASTHTIAKYTALHEGVYECRTRDSSSSWRTVSQVSLKTAVPPTVRSKATHSELNLGQPFLVSLAAEGTQPISFLWFKNGVPLAMERTNTLHFASVRRDHSGTYSCVIQNAAGSTVWLEATISVRER